MRILPGANGADYVRLTDAIKSWLLQNKVTFVARYLVPYTSIGKIITPTEIRWLHDHKIAILLNYEGSSNDGLGGATAGTRNGTWIKGMAGAYGYPTTVPLFCSIDTDTYAGNLSPNSQYVRAFAKAIAPYPLGLYGDTDIARAVADLSPIFWRANASSWGLPKLGQTVHIQQGKQVVPPGVDRNACLAPFNGWLPQTLPPIIHPIIGANNMPTLYCYIDPNGTAWIGNGLARRALADMSEFNQYVFLGATKGGPQIVTANGLVVRNIDDVAHVGAETISAMGEPI